MLDYIAKQRLIELMQSWGTGEITTEEMSFWCCNNYFPGVQTDDSSVPGWQQSAIHFVLRSFEWQAHDNRITARRENWERAIEFLNCTEETFEITKAAFEKECAGY